MLDDRGPDAVTFRISRDAHETYNVFGFDLSDYNTDYVGPIEFISPLNLRWPDGKSTASSTAIFTVIMVNWTRRPNYAVPATQPHSNARNVAEIH